MPSQINVAPLFVTGVRGYRLRSNSICLFWYRLLQFSSLIPFSRQLLLQKKGFGSKSYSLACAFRWARISLDKWFQSVSAVSYPVAAATDIEMPTVCAVTSYDSSPSSTFSTFLHPFMSLTWSVGASQFGAIRTLLNIYYDAIHQLMFQFQIDKI